MLKKIIILTYFLSFYLFGCSLPSLENNDRGFIGLGFSFPKKSSFSVKAIPPETNSFEVIISGKGLSSAIQKKITKSSGEISGQTMTKVLIPDVPLGKKNITVNALDEQNKIVASASKEIEVYGGKINKIELELGSLLRELLLRPEPLPSDTGKIMVKATDNNGKEYLSETTGKEIKILVPEGKIDIKMTILDKNDFPIYIVNEKHDVSKNQRELALQAKKIDIPELLDLSISEDDLKPENILNLLGKLLPKSLLAELENIIIPTPGNNKPVIENVFYSINGAEFIKYQLGMVINIKKSDQLKIKVKATDSDSDKINFFWGVTNLKKQSSNYQMRFIKGQNENIFNYQPQDEKTDYFIGFIISDRKSYLGPFTLSVRTE